MTSAARARSVGIGWQVGDARTPYRFTVWFAVRWVLGMLVGRARNLGRDGSLELARYRPRPSVVDIVHVPSREPLIVVMNHFERPGLRVWWPAMLVSAALWHVRGGGMPIRWLIAERFHGYRLVGVPIPNALVAWFLGRVAHTYGLIVVSRESGDAARRSRALIAARRALREGPESSRVVGITPEAELSGGPQMVEAWPDSGLAVAALSAGKIEVLPVGVYEDAEGRLVARFGPTYTLRREHVGPEELTRRVMTSVAELLPSELRGPYGATP